MTLLLTECGKRMMTQRYSLQLAVGEALVLPMAAWILKNPTAGRFLHATGSDAETARLAGIKVVTYDADAHPNLKAIVAVCSPAVPGAAEAVKQAGNSTSCRWKATA
jgi:ABC-type xylose transport system permease subunit